jgi:hypothetical protein
MRSNAHVTALQAALLMWGAACGLCAAQPEVLTLPNGLRTCWEQALRYDAVACAIACPEPDEGRTLGLAEVAAAALDLAASTPGGPRPELARVGAGISVGVRGGCILVEASGPSGTGRDLLRGVRILLTPPSVDGLVAERGLTDRLRGLSSGEPDAAGQAIRALLGPAWFASPREIGATCADLQPASLERAMADLLCGSRGAVSAATLDPADRAYLHEWFSSVPAGRPAAPLVRGGRGGATDVRATTTSGQSAVSLVTAGPPPDRGEAAAWVVAAQLLGRGNLSWAFADLRTRLGLSYQVAAEWKVEEGGILWLECHCDPGQEDATRDAESALVRRLADPGPSADEMSRATRAAQLQWIRAESAPGRRARLRALGMAWGGEATWPERLAEALPGVAAEDIRRVGETYSRQCVRVRVESETDAR